MVKKKIGFKCLVLFGMLNRSLHQRSEKLYQINSASGAIEEHSHEFASTAHQLAESNASPAQLRALRADREARARRIASRDAERKETISVRQRQREIRMARLAQQRDASRGVTQAPLQQQQQQQPHPSMGEKGKQLFRSMFSSHHAESATDAQDRERELEIDGERELEVDRERELEIDDVFAELDGLDIS